MFLLVERDGEPVGRVMAYEDRQLPEQGVGGLGFFECEDDEAAARELLGAAEDWLRERGLRRVRGPISPNMQLGTVGLYVDGEPGPPLVLMPYNPPYYARLFERCGYQTGQDLWALWGDLTTAELDAGLERIREFEADGLRFRSLDMKNLDRDVEAMVSIRNEAYAAASHYAFTQTTVAEGQFLIKALEAIVDPDAVSLVERDGNVIGHAIGVPDISAMLQALNGRLGPIRLIKALLAKRRIDAVRIADLAVKPSEQRRWLGVALMQYLLLQARANGYRLWENSWVAASNTASIKSCERLGSRKVRRYRVYERDL